MPYKDVLYFKFECYEIKVKAKFTYITKRQIDGLKRSLVH